LYISAILQSYNLPKVDDENESEKLKILTIPQLREILISLEPQLHNTTDLKSKDRLVKAILIERTREKVNLSFSNMQSLNIGISSEREELKKRITRRLKQRLAAGMIEEVKDLLQKGISFEKLNYFGLEYKFVSQYLDGKANFNDMFQRLNSAIHNFAKRQMTWFRKMEKEGIKINWFPPENYPAIKNFVNSNLNNAKSIS